VQPCATAVRQFPEFGREKWPGRYERQEIGDFRSRMDLQERHSFTQE
jgi:hypothetical protein